MSPNEHLPFGEQLGQLRTAVPGPRSRDLAKRLSAVEAPGITFVSSDFPIFWERAFGSNVEDVDGNLYVDLTSAFGVTSLGHGDPNVSDAVEQQLQKLPHGMGDVHPAAIKVELLERLSSLFPGGRGQSILCSSGAEAVEAALKTAALVSGRAGVITFEGSYHGLTYGTLAVGGQVRFREPFHRQLGQFAYRATYPRAEGDRNRDHIAASLRELDSLLEEAEHDGLPIGALLVEPIQGRAGVVLPPPGWLRALREWTEKKKIILIVDEIMTGFGRTGTTFAIARERVIPDLLCLGKALSNMMPFSACVGTEEAMRGWPPSGGEALHTSTFLGHPLGCAAALASIREIERRDLANRADRLGRETLSELRSWARDIPMVREVRGMGFMLGIELSRDDRSGLAFDVARTALARGVIVLPSGNHGNVVQLTPALTIGGRQWQWALSTIRQIISELT